MSLTNKQIWQRYSEAKHGRRLEIKRRLAVTELFAAELVTNGDFTTDTDWAKGANWSIADGKANASAVTDTSLSQDIGLESGFLYEIKFLMTSYASGTLQILMGDQSVGETIAQNGIYILKIRALGNSTLYLKGLSAFTAEIDDVSVKKVKEYEDDWFDISNYLIDKSVSPISEQIPDNLYEFGEVKVGSANLKLKNLHGELSDENNPNSIFVNFVRHNSLIRIMEGYIDRYTDPDNPILIETETFQGFIDDKTAVTTKDDSEQFSARALVSILSTLNVAELGTLTATNVNDLVYEIVNRGQFTAFFEVNTDNISAGYNTQSLNLSLIDPETKVIDLLRELAFGHSIFYVKDNVFYFRPAKPTSVVKHFFLNSPEKKISVFDFNQGGKNVIEKWFWSDTALEFISNNTKFGTSKDVDIEFIDNATERQNLLDFIGTQTENPKLSFKIELPFYPDAKIFDLCQIRRTEISDSKGAFVLDVSKLDEGILGQAIGAIKINKNNFYKIIGINHSANLKTTLKLQQVTFEDIPPISSDTSDIILACGFNLLKEDYSDNCLELRRNNSADTAVDDGSDDERDFIFRRKFLDTYLAEKWLNFNDFIDNALENASSDTGYLKTFYDQSGNTYDLSQATKTNQPKFDKVNNLIDFNGSDNFISRTVLNEVSNILTFSLSIIFTPASVASAQVLVNNIIGASNKFGLSFESGILRASLWNGASFISKSGAISAQRNSILVTFDGISDLKLYINGVLQTGTSDSIVGDVSAFVFGAKSASPNVNFYNGNLQNIIIFSKVINEVERENLNLFAEQF